MAILLSQLVIEPMQAEDVPPIMDIERMCFRTPWHENAFYNELYHRSACYLAAKVNGRVVGYAGMWVIMDEAHITTLAVHPHYRRQHIGERLLLALLEYAIARRARHATLEVRENNVAAQRLYSKYGFYTVAIRKGYYADTGENALIMWTPDMQTPEYRQLLRANRRNLLRSGEGVQ
ncbi:MAG: ribosomal protein S18-alanine N-acetyltransferase [Armatimonadota bacterium]|nr:ribosomal protein S18-alanine N-acetyltransferase [Armatimonadota bacterium]